MPTLALTQLYGSIFASSKDYEERRAQEAWQCPLTSYSRLQVVSPLRLADCNAPYHRPPPHAVLEIQAMVGTEATDSTSPTQRRQILDESRRLPPGEGRHSQCQLHSNTAIAALVVS